MLNEPTTAKFDGSNVYLGLSPEERRLHKNIRFLGAYKSGKSAILKSIAPYETNPCKELYMGGRELTQKFNFNRLRPGYKFSSITIYKDGPNNYVHVHPHIYGYNDFKLFDYGFYKETLARALELMKSYSDVYGEPGYFKSEYSRGQRLLENRLCENQPLVDQFLDIEPKIAPNLLQVKLNI